MDDRNMIEASQIEGLKKKINDNVAVNDNVICELCDELIAAAIQSDDLQSAAFGHVWRADYFFYVESNMDEVSRELNCANRYIDKKTPSILLEKFYTLKHVLYENSFHIQAAFHYCIKALGVAEKLDIKYRIGANYGNIGTYFLTYRCYEDALFYTEKAREVLCSLPETKPRISRILLSNLIIIYLKLGRKESVGETIKELNALPIGKEDLKLYVDYGYLLYYSEIMDLEKSEYYLQEMYNDGLLGLPNRAFMIELLINALEAIIHIKNQAKAQELMKYLKNLIRDEEAEPLLKVNKLKILYSQHFETKEEVNRHYREYYALYLKVLSGRNRLKVEGFRAKMELDDKDSLYVESKRELMELYELVNYDELTKVFSRRYLNLRQEEIINSKEYKNIGFILFDIDYFKEYNDFYGHVAGDNVLKQVAECLKDNAVEQIEVFRYGGDEFVCLCWDMDSGGMEAYTAAVSESLKGKHLEHLNSRCSDRITLSIGYGCRILATKFEMNNLFAEVDEALYQAKNMGRNNAKSI